jgi:transposase
VTGRRIIEAILQGERNPWKLAKLRSGRCESDEDTIAKALEGTWRPEHVFALRQAYELYQFHHQQIAACDEVMKAELDKLPDRAGDKRYQPRPRGSRKANDLHFEAGEPLFKALGVDLTMIEGIDVATALVILSELGMDVSRFPTEKHFASWLGVCPRQYESNKTKRKRRPRKGKNRIAIALRMAAQGLQRIGGKGAITATAHKLACLVYRMLRYGTEYVKQSMEEYERKIKEQMERALRRKAAALGYTLVPNLQPKPGLDPAPS